MRSIVIAGVLCAASVARADDPDGRLRAKLAAGDKALRGDEKIWAGTAAHLTGAPGGVKIVDVPGSERAVEQLVVDREGDAIRVWVFGMGVRLALWIDARDVLPSVTRETGVAASATALAPGPDDDGLFVEPGVITDGRRAGYSVHVEGGWIDAAATGPVFVESTALGDGWKPVPAGTKIVVGGRTILVAERAAHARTLPHGRGDLSVGHWRARGKLIVPKRRRGDVDDDVDGAEGGIEGGVYGGATQAPVLPDGTCLYDDAGHLVGLIDHAELVDRVVRTKDGYDVRVSILDIDGDVTLHARVVGKQIDRCTQ